MFQALIQLPDDARLVGYTSPKPFHWEAVYVSEDKNFKGTETEFLKAGHAYRYVQINLFERHELCRECNRSAVTGGLCLSCLGK